METLCTLLRGHTSPSIPLMFIEACCVPGSVKDTVLPAVTSPSCWAENSPPSSYTQEHAHSRIFPQVLTLIFVYKYTRSHSPTHQCNACGNSHPHISKYSHRSVPRNTHNEAYQLSDPCTFTHTHAHKHSACSFTPACES